MNPDDVISNKNTKKGIRPHWTNSSSVAIKRPRKLTENIPLLLKWKEKMSADCSPTGMNLPLPVDDATVSAYSQWK